MADHQPFVDYYAVLEVSPTCDEAALERAYRRLAKMYHPDHAETADTAKFNEVIGAYRAIRELNDRARYDVLYTAKTGFEFFTSEDPGDEEKSALSDADTHARVLRFLYKRRREAALDAGAGRYYVQEMLGCSDELFEFHLWYLKAKGFIELTEQGTLAITIEGIDHVIATSQNKMKQRLLTARPSEPDDPSLP